MKIPERLAWAVETLQIHPADHLLVIGCGRGVAARERNRKHVASGMASFQTVALADADFGGERFDKIFDVNVNVFWIKPARELAVVRHLLSPEGALYLFYQPPTESRVQEVVAKVSGLLTSNGLTVSDVLVRNLSTDVAVSIVAKDPPA